MKIAVITCYYQPDYVRAVTLRKAIADNPDYELIIIKNKHTGLIRYFEVAAKLIWIRLFRRPDAYLLTFRGYEMLPFTALATVPKPLIYDEFINPLEWLEEDRKELWTKFIPKRLLKRFYKLLLRRCKIVLADTPIHASSSKRSLAIPSVSFRSLWVGNDESIFHPQKVPKDNNFTVFFYATMLPLHGLDIVLRAFEILKDKPIFLIFAGGDAATLKAVEQSKANGAHIEHHQWIPYDQLSRYASAAHLTLGGPFGKTRQASMVVTGKTLQFLASSAPVLVGQTKVSGIFQDRFNSLVVPLGDPAALAQKILWAYEHQDKLPEIAKQGRRLYETEFSSEALAKEMAVILRELS